GLAEKAPKGAFLLRAPRKLRISCRPSGAHDASRCQPRHMAMRYDGRPCFGLPPERLMTASASFPLNGASENARVAALDACHALDTASEPALDNLVALAVRLFQVPCAFIVLVDRHRLYFKSVQGCRDDELPRAGSLGAYLVENRVVDPVMVPDA